MLLYLIPIAAALISGTATFWLRTYFDRVRLDLSLVSIIKKRDPDEEVKIDSRLVEISHDFAAGPTVNESARDSEMQEVYTSAKKVQESAEGQIKFARELKSRLRDCGTKQDKVEFLQDLIGDNLVFREINNGLRRHDLTIHRPAVGPEDLFESKRGRMEGRDTLRLEFPAFYHIFSYDVPSDYDRMEPFIEALKKFDIELIRKCLDFAINAIRQDHSRADVLTGGLEKTINSGPFKVDLMVVNRGKRAAVLNPYAALKTTGATSALPPLPLRIKKIVDSRGNEASVPEASFASIEPQAAVTLTLQSDPVEDSSPLTATYDKDILGCSVVLVRVKKNSRGGTENKVEETPRKDFGAKLDKELHDQVLSLASPR
ncbi:hypothetical protein ACH4NT_33325 [Streptomyces lydicus]|uniref:hypothetical protein n=1 Tax=Streptomyces lydicus TaxID=47763 RepID=UPI0037BA64DB